MNNGNLISPYGGKLVDLVVTGEERQELLAERSTKLPSVQISARSLCDLELLATGAFSPLDRFMGKADYERVLTEMRLSNGTLFPIPVTLPVDESALPTWGEQITLSDARNNTLAVMQIEEVYHYDPQREARLVLGTTDPTPPAGLRDGALGQGVRLRRAEGDQPARSTTISSSCAARRPRCAPAWKQMGHANVVAFQTRNPMHRIHEELTKRAAEEVDGSLLIHPVVGHDQARRRGPLHPGARLPRPGRELLRSADRTLLSLLPLAMRMAGPREALWHAIIRRNHGANHFIIGRDHAGPGNDSQGKPVLRPVRSPD